MTPSSPNSQPRSGKSRKAVLEQERHDRKSFSRLESTPGVVGTEKFRSKGLQKGPRAVISARAADRLRAGHVWVYRSDVTQLIQPESSSRLIEVVDSRGNELGTALYSTSSKIALRIVSSRFLDQTAWINLFRERVQNAFQLREKVLKGELPGTDSCRLVFSEADFLPGLIADKYNDLVVVQLLTQAMASSGIRDAFLKVVKEAMRLRAVYERQDPRIQEFEQLGLAVEGPLWSADLLDSTVSSSSTIFHLNGLRFHFEINSGQKTGAFLDQRENYAAAAQYCRGEALDVCTYQGGFALHLAQVCTRVIGIDASREALEIAERNLDLNLEILHSPVEWMEANAFDLLRDWSNNGSRFDSIVLDPPAFAKSKRAVEGALRGYKELNLRALKMLRPGGILVSCSCSHHVDLAEFTSIVTAAASDARRQVRLLERRGAARDHPVLLAVPETEYLKCLICRVE